MCLVVLAFTTVPGCGGCSSDETADKDQTKKDAGKADQDKNKDKDKQKADEKKKKKPPPPYEFVKPVFNVQPSDDSISRRAVKPGHWVTVTHHIRANAGNFYGELESQTLDRRQRPLAIENTAYDMLVSRPVALPKGEVKPIDATFFVPRQTDMEGQQIWLHHPFKHRSGSRLPLKKDRELAIRMPAYQFFFVVLSSNPDRYVFLKSIPSVRAPAVHIAMDHLHYYRVVLPRFQSGKAPLPSNALNWTTVAYLLWDNLDPTTLMRNQQTALLDWLHWGGQIIVSGPASLDALRGSFLDEYLPATNAQALELTAAHFRDLNDKWSLDVDRKTELETQLTVPADKPLPGIKLAIRPGAAYLPGTGELVVERRVGRGRIVVTAFPLADRSVVRWRSFDGFFNGCLLRRPKRKFDNNEMLSVTWERHPGLALDPLLASTVRYFSRDIRPMVDPQNERSTATAHEDDWTTYPPLSAISEPWQDKSVLESPHIAHRNQNTDDDDWHFGGFWFWTDSGVGGWNDKSGVANVARQTLKEAAGIVPPSRGDVLMMLSVYLIVLVPVNWFLFRLIGRVEWAWLMMPAIAIVGAVVVVWRAQLDIGFVRSRTEVAVLEVHGGYPRGHLSRYTALYSSLSTSFDFTFESDTVQALPFALNTNRDRARNSGEKISTLRFRRDRNVRLTGYQVKSNSTGILHSEQMYDLQGAIRLVEDGQGPHVVNESKLALRDVGVLRRTNDGVELAWVGQLDPASTEPLRFRLSAKDKPRFDEWNRSLDMLSFEVEARQTMLQYDTDMDKMLDKFEAAKIDRLTEFFDQADGRLLAKSTADNAVDGKLSLGELEFCCLLARDGNVGLGRFLDLTLERLRLGNGETRLIGWCDQDLGGMSIRPEVTQTHSQTFVIVHLRPANLPRAEPDTDYIGNFVAGRPGLNVLPDN